MKKRVRAIILSGNGVLLIHRVKQGRGEYWVFPGGGVNEGESYEAALKRELLEEVGVEIDVGNHFAVNNPGSSQASDQEEIFYLCSITKGEPGTGKGPEFQKGTGYEGLYLIEWMPFAEIRSHNILPKAIKEKLVTEVKQV